MPERRFKKSLNQTATTVKPFLKQYTGNLFWEIHRWKIPGYTYLGRGRGRVVFRKNGEGWVIKIPYNKYGVVDNRREVKMYKAHKGICFPKRPPRGGRGRLAKCTLVNIEGVDCVKMEFLKKIHFDQWPDWVFDLVDGGQIGRDKRGRIAVYDYALETLKRS